MATYPPITPKISCPCNLEALRSQLFAAQNAQQTAERAQQTAEVALAHEREANVTAAVRATIADAFQCQLEAYCHLDRTQNDFQRALTQLHDAYHTIHLLKTRLATLQLENRVLKDGYGQLELLCDSPAVGNPFRLLHSLPNTARLGSPSTTNLPDEAARSPTPSSVRSGHASPLAAPEHHPTHQSSWSHEHPHRSAAPHVPVSASSNNRRDHLL